MKRLQQQTIREVYRTSQPHFTDPQLVGYEICDYIRQVGLRSASFVIWHLMDYIWQHLKIWILFFTN